jgi:hypothetical protein
MKRNAKKKKNGDLGVQRSSTSSGSGGTFLSLHFSL